jgi:hypothetical protein
LNQLESRLKSFDKTAAIETRRVGEKAAESRGRNPAIARKMVALLSTELSLASAYVTIAKSDLDEEGANRKTARTVYEMMIHFLADAALPQVEERKIQGYLGTLKAGLQAMGEVF